MKKWLILLLICSGCNRSDTAAQPAQTGQVEQAFDLLHKSKQEALAMMGVTKEDLVAVRMEKGRMMKGGTYEINREEYENKHLYLRLYFSEENDITGYGIHFYYSADTNGASYRPDYEKLEALIKEKCTGPDESTAMYLTADGANIQLKSGTHLKTPLSDDTDSINFHLWEYPA